MEPRTNKERLATLEAYAEMTAQGIAAMQQDVSYIKKSVSHLKIKVYSVCIGISLFISASAIWIVFRP